MNDANNGDRGSYETKVSLHANDRLIAEMLRLTPDRKLYIKDKRSGKKYLLRLNREGQVCFLNNDRGENALMVLSDRLEYFKLDQESEDIVDEFLKEKERVVLLIADKAPARASISSEASSLERSLAGTKMEVAQTIESKRIISLSDICKEVQDGDGTFTINDLRNGKFRIWAVFKSENRAAFMQRKFINRWKVSCIMDARDRHNLVIEEDFSRDEINKAIKDLQIKIT